MQRSGPGPKDPAQLCALGVFASFIASHNNRSQYSYTVLNLIVPKSSKQRLTCPVMRGTYQSQILALLFLRTEPFSELQCS